MDTIIKRRKPPTLSPDIAESLAKLTDDELQERKDNIFTVTHEFDARLQAIDDEVLRLEHEDIDLSARHIIKMLSTEDFINLSEVNRVAMEQQKNNRKMEFQQLAIVQMAEKAIMAEIAKRKQNRREFENRVLQEYATPLFAEAQQRAAEAVRDLCVLAGWKFTVPMVGDAAIEPETIIRNAMNQTFAPDYSFFARDTLIAFEKEFRKTVLGGESNEQSESV